MDSVVSRARKAAGARGGGEPQNTGFNVMVTGQIEGGDFDGLDNLYVEYSFAFGDDWAILQGMDKGVSQIARIAPGAGDNRVVWNFPVDITFASVNAYGWPRLVVSVYGFDNFGNDLLRGYGCTHVPTSAGTYTRYARMFAPQPTWPLQRYFSWFTGAKPEFFEPKFVAQGEGREVTRVRSAGVVKLQLNVMTRGMAALGFTEDPSAIRLEQAAAKAAGTAAAAKGAGAGGGERRARRSRG